MIVPNWFFFFSLYLAIKWEDKADRFLLCLTAVWDKWIGNLRIRLLNASSKSLASLCTAQSIACGYLFWKSILWRPKGLACHLSFDVILGSRPCPCLQAAGARFCTWSVCNDMSFCILAIRLLRKGNKINSPTLEKKLELIKKTLFFLNFYNYFLY